MEKDERFCFDCAFYFPSTLGGATEFGICLEDAAFEPFADDLLEGRPDARCLELIERKKFPNDRPACERFEPAKTIEIEDDSLLGLELPRLTETGELDREKLERGLLAERLAAVDWADEPVDEEEAQLQSASPEKRDAALDTLAGKMSFGNTRARDALVRFLESLPPPGTLSEVHFKIKVLRLLERSHTRQDLVPILIRDIFRTRSNNTTRQWITAVFCFLERTSIEFTREPLERMLQEKRFSSRLKKKIKHILYEPRWE